MTLPSPFPPVVHESRAVAHETGTACHESQPFAEISRSTGPESTNNRSRIRVSRSRITVSVPRIGDFRSRIGGNRSRIGGNRSRNAVNRRRIAVIHSPITVIAIGALPRRAKSPTTYQPRPARETSVGLGKSVNRPKPRWWRHNSGAANRLIASGNRGFRLTSPREWLAHRNGAFAGSPR